MQSLVVIHAKQNSGYPSITEMMRSDIEDALTKLSPVVKMDDNQRLYTHRTSTGLFSYLSNEPLSNAEFNDPGNGQYRILLGHSNLNANEIFTETGTGSLPRLNSIRNASGCFGVLGIHSTGFHYICDSIGSFPAFISETPSFIVFSTRMTITYAVTRILENQRWDRSASYDLDAIRTFAASGHFSFRSTAFTNVKASKPGELLSVRGNDINHQQWDQISNHRSDIDISSYDNAVQSLAEAVVDACEPLAQAGTVKLTLTGGRDSRIVAAALKQFDIDVVASTSGVPTHPDVVIAGIIARKLGWEHVVTTPGTQPDRIDVELPRERLARILDVFGLETSAWDDVEPFGKFMPGLLVSGVGGELLRGGYSATKWQRPTPATVEAVLRNTLVGPDFVRKNPSSWLGNEADIYRISSTENPLETLDRLYSDNRNSRWVAARRRGQRFRRNTFDPLFDNRIVNLSRQFDIEHRWSEKLVFDVIQLLTPGLASLPIEGSAWRFQNPDFEGWKTNSPDVKAASPDVLTASARIQSTDFRRLENEKVRREFIESVNLVDSEIGSEILDMEKYRSILSSPFKYPAIMWHCYTALGIVSDGWMNTDRKTTISRPISFEIEDSNPN